jgi:hypothetical protein
VSDPSSPRALRVLGRSAAALVLSFGLLSGPFSGFVTAQAGLPTPRASPTAEVTQTIGLTDVTVNFSRPAVKGRSIWGGLVPYGQMWRVGANLNTTVTFASDAQVNGNDMPAGTYGFHVIPFRDKAWTVIFSKQTDLWGSFGYKKEEDALRLEVVPEEAPFQEWMAFEFSPVDQDSALMSLRWEKLRVPVAIDVELEAGRMAATRKLLRGGGADNPELLLAGAEYALANGGDLKEALTWAEKAVAIKKTFTNLGVQAQLLEELGRGDEAAPLRKSAWLVATEDDLSRVGGQLMSNRQYAEAVPVFQLSVRSNPKSWKAHDQLAEAYRKSGDADAALKSYAKALELTDDTSSRKRLEKTISELGG